MVTLITYHSSGGDEGRCDAKCYDAHEDKCECICGGRNHGAGEDEALDNTRELGQAWLDRAAADGTVGQISLDALAERLF